jgi:hypothetical protein
MFRTAMLPNSRSCPSYIKDDGEQEIPSNYYDWCQIAKRQHRQGNYKEYIPCLIASPTEILELEGEHGNLRYQQI